MASRDGGGLREWINGPVGRWVIGALALVAIAAAVFIWTRDTTGLEGARGTIVGKGRRVFLYCKGCGHAGRSWVPFDTTYPTTCPKCSAAKAIVGFKCTKCARVFEAPDAPIFKCPHCGMQFDRAMAHSKEPPPK